MLHKSGFGMLLCVLAAPVSGQSDVYGGASVSGIYSSSSGLVFDEDSDGSAIVGRGYAGVRWRPDGDTTRLQGSSTYYAYLSGRKDRWSNAIEAEQSIVVGKGVALSVEGSAATNISTLEARSVDQLAAITRLTAETGDHRFIIGAGVRRRSYDGSDARSWSPLAEVDYRYRLGRYRYLDLDARYERTDSDLDIDDYRRLSLAAYYTHPIGRDTRVRAGIAHRRWRWDERLTLSGADQRDQLWLQQARMTHSISDRFDLEADYRRIIRRSNNDALDRNGHRLAATVRARF